jgi:tRNA threonylcarbamoyladenosine biosynthesis protein TsaB
MPSWPTSLRAQVMALLDARMDEMYVATFAFCGAQWQRQSAAHLVRPESLELDATQPALSLAGNVFEVYAARLALKGALRCIAALPSAGAMLRLAPQLLAEGRAVSAAQALPTYVRDKVAQTTDERAAIKAAQAGAAS